MIVDCRLKGRTVEMALCLFCGERDHFMVNCDKYNKMHSERARRSTPCDSQVI